MIHKKLGLSTFIFICMLQTLLQAQEVIPASGGDVSDTGGTASYSVGQVVYSSNTGINGSVAQGVQQPHEISVLTELKEAKEIKLGISAHPNPTTGYLTVVVSNFELSTLNFQLFDMNGKLLRMEKIEGTETEINIYKLVPAIYFLKLMQGNKELKIFKIIKK